MANDIIKVGLSGDWHYDTIKRAYDLSRRSEKRVALPISHSKEAESVIIDPRKTALVIVDMQNAFLHPRCRDHPLGLETVQPIVKTITKCREVGIEIIWLNWGLTDTDLQTLPASYFRSGPRSLMPDSGGLVFYGDDLGDDKGRSLFRGSWNADIIDELKPFLSDGDAQCDKNRFSGLWSPDQPLFKHLRKTGMTSLVFCGVNTDRCVLGTLTDASAWGWDCLILEDCVATATEEANRVCLKNIELLNGFITDSSAIQSADVL